MKITHFCKAGHNGDRENDKIKLRPAQFDKNNGIGDVKCLTRTAIENMPIDGQLTL